jgi:hypothetical protein
MARTPQMSIEQRIREAVDTFTTKVRGDLDGHEKSLLADFTRLLKDAQESSRAELERAVGDARGAAERALGARLESLRAELARDMDARVSSERAKLEAAMAAERIALEAARAADRGALEASLAAVRLEMRQSQVGTFGRLLGAVRRLDEVTSLSAILETLARGAALEATRVAILIVDYDTLRSWGHFGFAAGKGPSDLPLANGGVLQRAVASKQASFVPSSADGANPGNPAFLRVPAGHIGLVLPIVVGDDVVALMYAEGVDRKPDQEEASIWTEEVELLVRHTALRLENVTSVRTVEVLTRPV